MRNSNRSARRGRGWFVGSLLVLAAVWGPTGVRADDAQDATPAPTGKRPSFQEAKPPINPDLPTLWIIGDSTVRNGRDNGWNGQWGWGNPIASYFDLSKINVQNRAVGGLSSRTFWRDQWPWILPDIKAGDFLLMQFGHNDAAPINDAKRARGTFRDNSDKVEEIDNQVTGKHERVHSYGWYLRKFASDAKGKGAKQVVILSPIPRNAWDKSGEHIGHDRYAPIAKEAADQAHVAYFDLNDAVIKKFEQAGKETVTNTLFPEGGEHTHPAWAGSVLIAETVIDGLKQLDSPLTQYLKPEPPKDLKNPEGKAR